MPAARRAIQTRGICFNGICTMQPMLLLRPRNTVPPQWQGILETVRQFFVTVKIVMGSLFSFCNGAAKGGQVGPE